LTVAGRKYPRWLPAWSGSTPWPRVWPAEVWLWREVAHLLAYQELKVYLDALQDGIGRLAEARAELSIALERISRVG
jgi:hypothetical protein